MFLPTIGFLLGKLSFFSSSSAAIMNSLGGGTGTSLLNGFFPAAALPAVRLLAVSIIYAAVL